MSAAVFRLPASSTFTAQQALESALGDGLKDVLVMGYDADGALYIRSSRMTCGEAS